MFRRMISRESTEYHDTYLLWICVSSQHSGTSKRRVQGPRQRRCTGADSRAGFDSGPGVGQEVAGLTLLLLRKGIVLSFLLASYGVYPHFSENVHIIPVSEYVVFLLL
jgi:hypothetical protein